MLTNDEPLSAADQAYDKDGVIIVGVLLVIFILVMALLVPKLANPTIDNTTFSINQVYGDVGHTLASIPNPAVSNGLRGDIQSTVDGYLYITPNNRKQTIKLAIPHWDNALTVVGSLGSSNQQYCFTINYMKAVPVAAGRMIMTEDVPVTLVYNQRGIVSENSPLARPCFQGTAYNDMGNPVH